MKRLLAALLLMVAPAFAQQSPQYDYTITNPTYTGLEGINQTQGVPTNLGDDGTVTGISIGFDFDFYGETFNLVNLSSNGLISFKNNINGCCSGELLPSNQYNDFGIFGIWTDLVNIGTINPYYKTLGEEGSRRFVVGWYDQAMFYDENQKSSFEITLFEGSNNILLSYGDINLNRDFTSGIQGYGAQGQFEQIYFGSDGNTLDNTSWLLTYSAVEPPPPPPPEEPIAPDCNINPNDPTCIINALIPDPTDEEFLADTGFDNGSSDGSDVIADEEDPAPAEEEMFAEADPIAEDSMEESSLSEESLEEFLAEESSDDEEVEEIEAVAAIKEMVNEEKASALSDNISKDVLGAALSIAADAVSAATVAGNESASSSATSSDSSSRSSTLTAAASETSVTTTETATTTESQSETTKEESVESSALAALEILDTGRQLGQEALAVTLAGAEASATESLSEAESIAATSSGDSVLASMSSIDTAAATVTEEQQTANNETTNETAMEETTTTETAEVMVADNVVESAETTSTDVVEQKEETKEEVLVASEVQTQQTTETTTEQKEEVVVAEVTSETVVESVEQVVAEVQTEQQSAIEFTTVEEAMEVFASNVNQQAAAEQEELENNIIQQAIASSQNNEEENRMGFAEAEAVTIASDPALANAFNVQPNTASLELLGVLGSRAEEKSDAELRAEQVVAANKEQQDAINANYMDADQSGIVAAIGAEADVSSYLSQRLQDVPFYKPEDIYKGVIIKDNVRGSYFLEKGNTDTYKKMVEEQYK